MEQTTRTELTEDTITLLLDSDREVECDILAIFPVKDRFYIALMPQTPVEGYEEGEYFLYRYTYDGEHAELSDIQSEDELDLVEDKFEELLDEEAFHRME